MKKDISPLLSAISFTGASPVAAILMQIAGLVLQATTASREAAGEGNKALAEEIDRQKLELQAAERQSRVAQELAIAERIRYSHSVKIEEFYDGEAKGKAGAFFTNENAQAGLSGEARKVTRRIYEFSGNRIVDLEQANPTKSRGWLKLFTKPHSEAGAE